MGLFLNFGAQNFKIFKKNVSAVKTTFLTCAKINPRKNNQNPRCVKIIMCENKKIPHVQSVQK